jgi:Flp pilus assembly protein TadD
MRIGNALLSYGRYIGKMVWPTRLAIFYPLPPGLPAAAVMGVGIGLVAVTAEVIWAARRKPWLVTGWFWYLGMLVPVIGLLQGAGESMADRFTYLPSIGLLIMLCWNVPSGAMERRSSKVITCVAAGTVLAACGILSSVQVGYWKNSETLFRHALDVTRDNWLAQNNLGVALERTGRVQEAIGHYEQAVRIRPGHAETLNNLGDALSRVGKLSAAIVQYEQALQIEPDLPGAQNNLAWLLATLVPADGGDPVRAVILAQRACELTNNRVAAYFDTLAAAYAATGRFNDAIATAQKGIELAKAAGQSQLVEEIELHLKLYRSGQPYHQPIDLKNPPKS